MSINELPLKVHFETNNTTDSFAEYSTDRSCPGAYEVKEMEKIAHGHTQMPMFNVYGNANFNVTKLKESSAFS